MLTREQNDQLTRTDPGTPMGNLIRRYWVPALLSEEVPAPDCAPVRVHIMGEHLVAFRDSQGRVGLVDEHCAHRGTSLLYGRNEQCGLRCVYHGWKFDVEGRVVDTPAEPTDSDFKGRVRLTAYPCHEVAGMVFAYLGPADARPLFPAYSWTRLPMDQTYVTKCLLECNYLQGVEGECDSAHLSFLHSSVNTDERDRQLFEQDSAPRYETEDTDFGLRLVALRTARDGQTYVRVSSFSLPTYCWVPARNKEVHIYVPADDRHAWRYDFGFLPDRKTTEGDLGRKLQIDANYRRVRNVANDYLQDRDAQRSADFTGIEDFLNEDACATESMGAIYDRRREHLGVSDKGVIAMRHRLLRILHDAEAGMEPPHLVRDPEHNEFAHVDTLAETIPAGVAWQDHYPHLRAGVHV